MQDMVLLNVAPFAAVLVISFAPVWVAKVFGPGLESSLIAARCEKLKGLPLLGLILSIPLLLSNWVGADLFVYAIFTDITMLLSLLVTAIQDSEPDDPSSVEMASMHGGRSGSACRGSDVAVGLGHHLALVLLHSMAVVQNLGSFRVRSWNGEPRGLLQELATTQCDPSLAHMAMAAWFCSNIWIFCQAVAALLLFAVQGLILVLYTAAWLSSRPPERRQSEEETAAPPAASSFNWSRSM